MSAIVQSPRLASLNRRRRVRQKVHAPAYATFSGASNNEMLDLYEVLDISEVGVAVQCPVPMTVNQNVDLCLDLAESSGQISATMRVVWSDSDGRVGLSFQPLAESDQHCLRQWLFLNAMAGAANAASCGVVPATKSDSFISQPSYTDTLNAAAAMQGEVESLGSDLEAILSLVASRAHCLLRASGSAIALGEKDSDIVICRASSGPGAPPVGVVLQKGSGFSGDCLRTGKTLRCDDAETDARVDTQICCALGIRSMLASPIGSNENVVGLIEVFSARPRAFDDNDSAVLERMAETLLAAVNRSTPQKDIAVDKPPSTRVFPPGTGSVLFAHYPTENLEEINKATDKGKSAGVLRLPRGHLYLLIATLATLALAVGFISAPWIQPWIQKKIKARAANQAALASSQRTPDSSQPSSAKPSFDSANPEQLRALAQQENADAENAIGLLYAQGDQKQAIKKDEAEAARWFIKAAEHGSVPAQYKLGLLYWGGHGVPKDASKAYFWAVLARAGGQQGSKDLANVLANGMSRSQATAIEQQAEIWYQQHESQAKPSTGH